jgi:hypothetical protein
MDRLAVLLPILVLCITGVGAHVPVVSEDGFSDLETAAIIPDGATSFAFFGGLKYPGDRDYYRLDFDQGDRIVLSLSTPDPGTFNPSLILIGAGFPADPSVEIDPPPGTGVKNLSGARAQAAELEPFTPIALYEILAYEGEATVSGPVYVVVTTNGIGGRYVLGTGYAENFGPLEWIALPIERLRIHRWQGQPLLIVAGPIGFFIVIGGLLLSFRRPYVGTAGLLVAFAGLMYIGSGCALLVQTAIAVLASAPAAGMLITVVLAMLAIGLGGILLFTLRRPPGTATRARLLLSVIGLVGLGLGAGVVVGPGFALAAALIPVSAPPATKPKGVVRQR